MSVEIREVRPGSMVELGRLFASRKRRTAAVVILTREAAEVAKAGKVIAENDLHRRDANRRTDESLAHGAEYHDSFEVAAPRISADRIEIRVGNTHPAARIIEGGSNPHPITPRRRQLAFPFNGGARGGPNRKGGFAVAWGSAPVMRSDGVAHPGSAPKRILYRAVVRWRSTSRLRRRSP